LCEQARSVAAVHPSFMQRSVAADHSSFMQAVPDARAAGQSDDEEAEEEVMYIDP